ncbi:hypothetical protein BaRGS_00009682 [Batillaria attramentaria]|uniref:Uncharacterized protein n=1 Tax=Batillaria attramentaria TaxID=370345 RepID=A0ABD0LI82_9CAEN
MNRKPSPAPIFNHRKRQREAVLTEPELEPLDTTQGGSESFSKFTAPQDKKKRCQIGLLKMSLFTEEKETEMFLLKRQDCEKNSSQPGEEAAEAFRRHRLEAQHLAPKWAFHVALKSWTLGRLHQAVGCLARSSEKQYCEAESQRFGLGFELPGKDHSKTNSSRQPPAQPSPSSGLNTSAKIQKQVSKSGNRMEKADMRVLTLAIADVKRWGYLNVDTQPLLFEVFGIVDSAAVKKAASSRKSFMLRDETNNIGCVFFEIDRQLPRLIRGQWYRWVNSECTQHTERHNVNKTTLPVRCIGILQRSCILQCVSVRPASMEERNSVQALVTASVHSVRELSKRTHEQ